MVTVDGFASELSHESHRSRAPSQSYEIEVWRFGGVQESVFYSNGLCAEPTWITLCWGGDLLPWTQSMPDLMEASINKKQKQGVK